MNSLMDSISFIWKDLLIFEYFYKAKLPFSVSSLYMVYAAEMN